MKVRVLDKHDYITVTALHEGERLNVTMSYGGEKISGSAAFASPARTKAARALLTRMGNAMNTTSPAAIRDHLKTVFERATSMDDALAVTFDGLPPTRPILVDDLSQVFPPKGGAK